MVVLTSQNPVVMSDGYIFIYKEQEVSLPEYLVFQAGESPLIEPIEYVLN